MRNGLPPCHLGHPSVHQTQADVDASSLRDAGVLGPNLLIAIRATPCHLPGGCLPGDTEESCLLQDPGSASYVCAERDMPLYHAVGREAIPFGRTLRRE